MSNIDLFKQRLKELRGKYNMTQQDLASQLGIVRTAIANYETGRTSPDPETLSLIANIFETSTDYLLGRTYIKEPIDSYINKDVPLFAKEDITSYNRINNNVINIGTIAKLSLKNQKRIFEYIQMIKLLEDNNIDLEKEDKKR